jgi:cytochrome c-type biogenesis protein CcmH
MIVPDALLKTFVLTIFLLFIPLSHAKEATPMAIDPEMEKTVNKIASELRCLVCQNQTIADSHAGLAIDLKNQVREMVKTGQSQKEIVDYMVKRYGDFVLYRPPLKTTTVLLWAGPFLFLLVGFTVLVINLRKRRTMVINEGELSSEENERLKALLISESEDNTAKKEGSQSNKKAEEDKS